MRKALLVVILLTTTVAFSGDEVEPDVTITKTSSNIFKPVITQENKKLYTIVPKPERVKGKTDWVVDHIAVMDGWSFTGYSKFGLTENLNPYRWHFGIISGELDANTALDLHEPIRPSYELLERWEHQRNHDVVFGVSFIIRF